MADPTGTQILPPNAERALEYSRVNPKDQPVKYLYPDGSVWSGLPVFGAGGSGINAGTDGGSLGLTYDFSDYDGTDPIYIGSLRSDGSWIIQAYAVSLKQMRYCAGASGYATNWTNRASLTYVLRNEL